MLSKLALFSDYKLSIQKLILVHILTDVMNLLQIHQNKYLKNREKSENAKITTRL